MRDKKKIPKHLASYHNSITDGITEGSIQLIKQKMRPDDQEDDLKSKLAKIIEGMNKGIRSPMNFPPSDILYAFKESNQTESS
jgi:DNA replication protein DnaD